MARAPREHRSCTECDWAGRTRHSTVRVWIFRASTLAVALLVLLELGGITALGDRVLSLGLTIMLVSIVARILLRGDRCPRCGARAVYVKHPK